ncbi:MAG: phytoene/squalene synthase family protein [Pseudomonadota bacterium]
MTRLRLPAADVAALREIIRVGSLSFYAASRLLPADIRDGAFAIYAFCRMSDDTIDCGHAGASGLTMLHRRLDAAYAGHPHDTVIDRCFAAVIHHYDIPKAYPEALLEGFAWDIDEQRYETLSDVRAYGARVAGSVGAMMAVLMGARSPAAIARATDLGTAMQLTNIARDVGEDAREGRLYLPAQWLAEGGLSPARFLARPSAHPAVLAATHRLLAEADRLYARGLSGLAHLPPSCRPAIRAAGSVYREIGAVIAENGYDSVSRRAIVPARRKLAKVASALPAAFVPHRADPSPPLDENRFLIVALTSMTTPPEPAIPLGPGATMLDLLLKLNARDRELASATGLSQTVS